MPIQHCFLRACLTYAACAHLHRWGFALQEKQLRIAFCAAHCPLKVIMLPWGFGMEQGHCFALVT